MPIYLIEFAGIFENAFESRAELAKVRAHDLTETVKRVDLFVDGENRIGKRFAYPFQNSITALKKINKLINYDHV